MRPKIEELDTDSRAMDRPPAPGWVRIVIYIVWTFALVVWIFNSQ